MSNWEIFGLLWLIMALFTSLCMTPWRDVLNSLEFSFFFWFMVIAFAAQTLLCLLAWPILIAGGLQKCVNDELASSIPNRTQWLWR